MGAWVRFLLVCAALLATPAPAAATECLSTYDLPLTSEAAALEAALGRTRGDSDGRVVAPITVNGQGPFPFIVDTGANRSVLSQGLATELGLVATSVGEVHSVHDVTEAPIAVVESIRYGQLSLPSQPVPLLDGPMLAGQRGMLGVDGMAGRRLQLDFVRRCIEIVQADRARRLTLGWTTIRGELRFGHLVVLPGHIRNVAVNVLIDTGSDVTLANVALRDALRARAPTDRGALNYARAYTAGTPVVLDDVVALPQLRMGELTIGDVLAYIGDFHIFELWQMHDQPTLLIGMDVLRRTRSVAIDYSRGSVSFRLRGGPQSIVRFQAGGDNRPRR